MGKQGSRVDLHAPCHRVNKVESDAADWPGSLISAPAFGIAYRRPRSVHFSQGGQDREREDIAP